MAKTITAGRMLDPVQVGEIAMTRRTKGTPYTAGGSGFNLDLNRMPPGLDISNQQTFEDAKHIVNMTPIGPILR